MNKPGNKKGNTQGEQTRDQKVQNIASTQPDYVDEYEGFGSLTEMIKN